MLEFIVYLILGTAVLLVVLACISVFISYVTQASYIDPLHPDDCCDDEDRCCK